MLSLFVHKCIVWKIYNIHRPAELQTVHYRRIESPLVPSSFSTIYVKKQKKKLSAAGNTVVKRVTAALAEPQHAHLNVYHIFTHPVCARFIHDSKEQLLSGKDISKQKTKKKKIAWPKSHRFQFNYKRQAFFPIFSNNVEVYGVILMATWPFERGCFICEWLAPRGALVFLPVSIHPQWLNSTPRSQLVLVLQARCCPPLGPCTDFCPDLQATAGKMLSAGHSEQVLLMTHMYGFIFIQFETHWACDSSHSKRVFASSSFFCQRPSLSIRGTRKWRGLRLQSRNQLVRKALSHVFAVCCLWEGRALFFSLILTFSTAKLIQMRL